jgi:multisubunit Na+/H+ antiporter MnhC subunit
LTTTEAAPSPISLAAMKLDIGLALALHVKVVLSAMLRGSKVKVLVNDGLEPDTEEMVTLALPLDKCALPLSQVMSLSDMVILVSVAELMEMLQVRVREAIRPA